MTPHPSRPSALPRAYYCSGFIRKDMDAKTGTSLTYQGDRQAAMEGSAAHLLTANWLKGGEMTGKEAVAKYAVHGCEAEPGIVEWLAREAVDYQQKLTGSLDSRSLVETRVEGVFPGTPDALVRHRDSATVFITDFKFGRVRRPGSIYQLMGYAATQMGEYPWIENAMLFTVYPRLQEHDEDPYTREQIGQFLSHMWNKEKEARTAPKFTIGTHCDFCPHALTCPAINTALKQLPDIKPDASMPESIEAGRAIKGAVLAWVERFKQAEKAFVSKGDITLPSGKRLHVREQDKHRVTKSSASFFRKVIPPNRLLELATFSKGDLVKEVKARATGKKKDAEAKFIAEAIEARAIQVTTTRIVEED